MGGSTTGKPYAPPGGSEAHMSEPAGLKNLVLVVVGKDQSSVDAFAKAHVHLVRARDAGALDLRLVANQQARSLASIGNREIDETMSSSCFRRVVGLVHADCVFAEGALEVFVEVALGGRVCGIAGRDMGKGNRWACNIREFHDGPVASLLPGTVSTLDSNSAFFRLDLGLRFDESAFDGMHCHVEDLCLQAHERGFPAVVPAANATHRGDSAGRPGWRAQYLVYRKRLAAKWPYIRFETT